MRFLLSMALAFLLLAAMAVALMTGSAAAQEVGQYQIVPLPQPLGEGRAVSAPSSGILPAAYMKVAIVAAMYRPATKRTDGAAGHQVEHSLPALGSPLI